MRGNSCKTFLEGSWLACEMLSRNRDRRHQSSKDTCFCMEQQSLRIMCGARALLVHSPPAIRASPVSRVRNLGALFITGGLRWIGNRCGAASDQRVLNPAYLGERSAGGVDRGRSDMAARSNRQSQGSKDPRRKPWTKGPTKRQGRGSPKADWSACNQASTRDRYIREGVTRASAGGSKGAPRPKSWGGCVPTTMQWNRGQDVARASFENPWPAVSL